MQCTSLAASVELARAVGSGFAFSKVAIRFKSETPPFHEAGPANLKNENRPRGTGLFFVVFGVKNPRGSVGCLLATTREIIHPSKGWRP